MTLPATRLSVLSLVALAACASTPKMDTQSICPVDDGAFLHVQRVGAGEDVLIVPGASWLAEDVMRLARGRTVVFYDLRGRGRSSSLPPDAPPTLEGDLADLETLRAWLGVERFSILAHDYQATVAAYYASLHPERVERMVLVSPVPARRALYYEAYLREYNKRLDRAAFRKLAVMHEQFIHRTDPETYARAARDAMFSAWVVDRGTIRDMRSNPLVEPNIDPELTVGQYQKLLGQLGDWDWRPALRRVTCPTLLVHGEHDLVPLRSSQEWAATIPGAQELLVERCGRMPWLEQPSVFFSATERFLDGR